MTDIVPRPRREPISYQPSQPGEDRLIPIARVCELSGYSKSRLYQWMRADSFPKPCHPGRSSSRWSEREVVEWKDEQLAARTAA
jgi:predicted DNA-binding transcriptional regulator AlpA